LVGAVAAPLAVKVDAGIAGIIHQAGCAGQGYLCA
jgi:hypothetical protein